ncbi:uncharacterized protein Bfra_003432 [Botrytis fragariae]|uniref:Uncharacterized protein n=1 Tax=Botrytis fragariae TaxID=1964551 RepID=A0A8H6EJZ1_9HELO|nr:uncharacterized protein Bfra_003432 [Botrytis fragariae]KAF5874979.1 hypothetical protein Bfra_003432 [Botrytis fragariae]
MIRRAKTSSIIGLTRSWIRLLGTLLRKDTNLQNLTPTVAFYAVSTLGHTSQHLEVLCFATPSCRRSSGMLIGLSISSSQSKGNNPSKGSYENAINGSAFAVLAPPSQVLSRVRRCAIEKSRRDQGLSLRTQTSCKRERLLSLGI